MNVSVKLIADELKVTSRANLARIDIESLGKALEDIRHHPEEWDQRAWAVTVERENFCGTALCLAGRVLHNAGASFSSTPVTDSVTFEGRRHPVRDTGNLAAEHLNLPWAIANGLWSGSNKLEDLESGIRLVVEACEKARYELAQEGK